VVFDDQPAYYDGPPIFAPAPGYWGGPVWRGGHGWGWRGGWRYGWSHGGYGYRR
jgi:hypothetical protein